MRTNAEHTMQHDVRMLWVRRLQGRLRGHQHADGRVRVSSLGDWLGPDEERVDRAPGFWKRTVSPSAHSSAGVQRRADTR